MPSFRTRAAHPNPIVLGVPPGAYSPKKPRSLRKLSSVPYHSLGYLTAEEYHVLAIQRILFILFFILSAANSYVNAALSFRESDVDLANVTSIKLILPKKSSAKQVKLKSVVNRGMVMKPVNKDATEYLCWKVHDRAQSFVLRSYTMHELHNQHVSIS